MLITFEIKKGSSLIRGAFLWYCTPMTEGTTTILLHAEHFLSPKRLDQLQTKLAENHSRSQLKEISPGLDDKVSLTLDVMGFLLGLESYTELTPKEQLLFMAAHLHDLHYLVVGAIKATEKELVDQIARDRTEDVFLLQKRADLIKSQLELSVVTSIVVKYAQIEEHTSPDLVDDERETIALMTERIMAFCNALLEIIGRQPETANEQELEPRFPDGT